MNTMSHSQKPNAGVSPRCTAPPRSTPAIRKCFKHVSVVSGQQLRAPGPVSQEGEGTRHELRQKPTPAASGSNWTATNLGLANELRGLEGPWSAPPSLLTGQAECPSWFIQKLIKCSHPMGHHAQQSQARHGTSLPTIAQHGGCSFLRNRLDRRGAAFSLCESVHVTKDSTISRMTKASCRPRLRPLP